MTRRGLWGAILMAVPAMAGATDVVVQARGADGRPLVGAVVQIASPGVAAPRPLTRATMGQRDIAFDPHMLIVPVGTTVGFPNADRVRHHVYSFSTAKKFELKLYGRDDSRSVLFDRPGMVALGCNIHDRMSGFIAVVDTPFAGVSDAAGAASFAGVPPGPATVTVWHPSIRAPGNLFTARIQPAGASFTATVAP